MNFAKAVVTALVFELGVMALYGLVAQTNLFPNVNLPIPNGDENGVQDIRTVVSDVTYITSVNVRLNVAGNFNGDLYGYLRHTSGSTTHISVLLNRPGRTASNIHGYSDSGFDATFADSATNDIHTYRSVTAPPPGSPLTGEWQPDARFADPGTVSSNSPRSTFLGAFTGMNAAGEWTLFLADVDGGATNFLNSWGLEITGKTTPAITWTNPAAIAYGTALGIDQLNATAGAGTLAYNPPAGTVLSAGTNKILSVTFTPEDTNSYVVATASVTLDVLPQALTITANDATRLYGGTNPVFAGTMNGVTNGDNITASYISSATTNSGVATYPITPVFQDPDGKLANYTVLTNLGTLTVAPAPLLVRANDARRPQGQPNPVFTATISGLVNGEDSNALSGALLFNTVADTNSPVGTYAIEPGGLSATNYALTFSNGTLAVTAFALSVSADSKSRVYGATNPPLTGTLTGVTNGDNITVTFQTIADANSPVGAYPITPVLHDPDTNLVNYTVTLINGVLTIVDLPRLLSIAESPEGTTFSLVWQVYPGRIYEFQFKTNLTDTVWTPLGNPYTNASTSFEIPHDVGTNRQRFYRALDVTTP